MIEDTKHFCMLPFVHYEIEPAGHVAPCRVSRTVYHDENDIPFNVKPYDKVRQQNITDIIPQLHGYLN